MSTIKPFEVIMRPYLWDLPDLKRPPQCPHCGWVVAIVQDLCNMDRVFVLCKQCGVQGPGVDVRTEIAPPAKRMAAAENWNRMIESIYHLAHETTDESKIQQKED